MEDDAFNKTKC